MENYYVPQPKSLPSRERQAQLIQLLLENSDEIDGLWQKTSNPYLGWEKFEIRYRQRHFGLSEVFDNVSADEAWFLLHFKRLSLSQITPIISTKNERFRWSRFPYYEKDLRDFDMRLGGNVMFDKLASGSLKRERFLRQSLIEEAIASSQLEGAAITRERAKKMIAENKRPRTHDEWMIYNNYQTIRRIEQETVRYPLSRDVLLDLHVLMTKHAIDPDMMGRWRKDEDEIVVNRIEGPVEFVAHVPPNEAQLHVELDRLIAFANDEDDDLGQYVHPIIKAIMLHFWFAYLHPFADGNGRLARSLFYWYLLRHDYWLISYVPISTVIRKSPVQYSDAYLFSEQYANDLTYFIEYNFRKLRQALEMFDQHVERVREKDKIIDSLIPDKDLNARQRQAIHHLIGRPDNAITARQHADFHEVGWLTASKDLKDLESRGYLDREPKGREVYYKASDKLKSFAENDI